MTISIFKMHVKTITCSESNLYCAAETADKLLALSGVFVDQLFERK